MENDKQWITYVIIANSEAGCLEIRTAQRQRKSGYRSFKKAYIFLGENWFINFFL